MENRVDSSQQKRTAVDFTLAMTHSRGRSCHRVEGVEEGEEWPDCGCIEAGVHMAPEASTGPV